MSSVSVRRVWRVGSSVGSNLRRLRRSCAGLTHVLSSNFVQARHLTASRLVNNSHPSSYQYRKLPDNCCIRLLEIPARASSDAAKLDAPITCRLVTVSLADKPFYDALSYSWDGQPFERILHVQDGIDDIPQQLLITPNCDDAIRELSRAGPLRIWIDAICINQRDTLEKNVQVSMMKDIYANAAIVRVWLGPASDDSYEALGALVHLWGTSRSLHASSRYQATDPAVVNAISSLGQRSYWQRIWTLQEVAFAKVVLIHVGDQRVHYWSLAQGCVQTKYDMHYVRMGGHFFLSMAVKEEIKDDGLPRLLTTLIMAQSKHSSEPRDKIYAVISLFPDMFKDVVVDYSQSIEEVYTSGSKAFIEYTISLEHLFYRTDTEVAKSTASWVVDWSNTEFITYQMLRAAVPKQHTKERARIAFSNRGRTLSVYGRTIGTVEHVGWPLSRKYDHKLEDDEMGMPKYLTSYHAPLDIVALRSWLFTAISALNDKFTIQQITEQFTAMIEPYEPRRSDLTDWINIMATDLPLTGRTIQQLDVEWQRRMPPGFEEILRFTVFPKYEGPLIELAIHYKILMILTLDKMAIKKVTDPHFGIIRLLGGHRFFITAEGIMGTGDEHLKKGDRIFVIEGSSFPMIVRNDGTKNMFVGPARVPSIDVQMLLDDKQLLQKLDVD